MGDLIGAACALLAVSESSWPARVELMFDLAHRADNHRLLTGRSHPNWGNGSLMSIASELGKTREPFLSDPKYLRALKCVIERALECRGTFVS
jgi:hypothetical protein